MPPQGLGPPPHKREPLRLNASHPPIRSPAHLRVSGAAKQPGTELEHAGGQTRRWIISLFFHPSRKIKPQGQKNKKTEGLRDVFSFSSASSTSSTALGLLGVGVALRVSVSQAAPAGLVAVQVGHHGAAERAGLSEALPLLEERLHDVGDEAWRKRGERQQEEGRGVGTQEFRLRLLDVTHRLTCLDGGDSVRLLVAHGTDLQVKLLLQVACRVHFDIVAK